MVRELMMEHFKALTQSNHQVSRCEMSASSRLMYFKSSFKGVVALVFGFEMITLYLFAWSF